MAGFGIQKKGTSPLLVKRKGFVSGGDVDEAPKPLPSLEEEKPKTLSEGVKEGVRKLGEKSSKIVKDVAKKIEEDPGVMGTGDPQRKFKKSKSPKKDEPMKPMKKLSKEEPETPAEMKKGGSVKKGILIIIGNKDKKSKGMKKGGLAKQAAIAIAMKKAGKKPKGMKK